MKDWLLSVACEPLNLKELTPEIRELFDDERAIARPDNSGVERPTKEARKHSSEK